MVHIRARITISQFYKIQLLKLDHTLTCTWYNIFLISNDIKTILKLFKLFFLLIPLFRFVCFIQKEKKNALRRIIAV